MLLSRNSGCKGMVFILIDKEFLTKKEVVSKCWHNLFFMRKARTFPSPGFVITQSLCNFRHHFFRYGKVTFSSLHSQPNRSFSTKN